MPSRPNPTPPLAPSANQGLRALLANGRVAQAKAQIAKDPQAHLYLGLGLAGRAMSQGLAIDVLALVALTEHLRRLTEPKHATILIADTNAVAAGYPEDLVQALAQTYLDQIRALCAHMDSSIEVTLASQWDRLAGPSRLPRAAQRTAPYVRVQLEQMQALFAHGYRIKVGWRMPGAKRDEQHFDQLYRDLLEDPTGPHRLQTIYGLAGRSFAPAYPRACPYVTYEEQSRILLDDADSVRTQIGQGLAQAENPTRGYRRHLIKIARGLRPLLGDTQQKRPALDLLEDFRRAARSNI